MKAHLPHVQTFKSYELINYSMGHVLSFCLDKHLPVRTWKAKFTFRILDPNVVMEDSWPLSVHLPPLAGFHPHCNGPQVYTCGHSPEHASSDHALEIAGPEVSAAPATKSALGRTDPRKISCTCSPGNVLRAVWGGNSQVLGVWSGMWVRD